MYEMKISDKMVAMNIKNYIWIGTMYEKKATGNNQL